jgi:ribosomal protein L11 methyltransferase
MLQLKIEQCLRDEADRISDLLEERGAVSVTLTDRYDSPILEPEIGTTPLWFDVVIHALFQSSQEADLAKHDLTKDYPHLKAIIEELPEQDWERVCLADFVPQKFGKRLWICPSWLTPPEPTAINLTLDPGLAFGTGTHPTTGLCLTWLEQAALSNKRVIDYGCGSGILALAAKKLGASHVDAVDLDEQAIIATRSNAINNHLSIDELSVTMPNALHEPVDIVIANILLKPLLQLKSEFRRLLKPGGLLVVSGILNDQSAELRMAYQDDFVYQSSSSQDEWGLIVFSG